MLTTLATIKARLKLEEFDLTDDVVLTRLIAAVSGRFDRHCNRTFARTENAIEQFQGDDTEIRVSCYPIEAISAFDLKTNDRTGWEAQTLTDIEYLTRHDCVISLTSPLGTWKQMARVTYTGGYVLPGNEVAEGQSELPAEIQDACVEQVAYWYQNKDRLGIASISGEGGTVNVFHKLLFLPEVEATLSKYRRFLA
jgi:hypothetical protein